MWRSDWYKTFKISWWQQVNWVDVAMVLTTTLLILALAFYVYSKFPSVEDVINNLPNKYPQEGQ